MGHRISQYSSDFKQQRTRQKRHWKEAQDHQDFEMRSKHLMTSLERSLVQESADNEDYKQQGTYKKRKSKEAQDDQDFEKRSKHPIPSLGHSLFQDSEGSEQHRTVFLVWNKTHLSIQITCHYFLKEATNSVNYDLKRKTSQNAICISYVYKLPKS